ncbi:DNA/RNA helicase domain-containing protein [Myroides profundi]|uniref:Schlafen group 3-like DNA/RNA helicase domain-containing protein n=1 Tax=Myroides profundi TaxID=480520 RepID=A0AAJ4W451_MYRPR|nr:DNA/RNA helicase domain-containing protein [Myroides profundi]AJH14532.1 hypothetical protein MPR_1350 [Myroides profundi]SEQ93559.1 hypothetical protein SAMN04488089_107158 [Myroides profundi]
MIVYHKTKEGFCNDILTNDIDNIILNALIDKTGKSVGQAELNSFRNSLMFINNVVSDSGIPKDCNISIEYHIPQTSKRVDFIITGNDGQKDHVIIIELKQWQEAEITDKDGVVKTRFKHGIQETAHPSYQAYSYACLLNSFNATIEQDDIKLHPCAYLHNYAQDDVITNSFYQQYLNQAPVFLKSDAKKLIEFIKQFIKYGDNSNILYRIENGEIRPNKSLADALSGMMKGNQEFVMIDDQKIVFETAKKLAFTSRPENKNVLIVEGGPGTGKSVVAINLLVQLTQMGKLAQYVTKTAAPRDVYFHKLVGDKKKVELKQLFVGSGSFMNTPPNVFNALIVDEAHRLTEKTGFLRQGKNQIQEILESSLFSIFFIDENQRVHIDDYGDIAIIEQFAKERGINIHRLSLESQFRCNGSDGYLAWVDHALQIRETANTTLKDIVYDFKVLDDPLELQELIYKRNIETNNRARLVAGYCWPWNSKKDTKTFDITFKDSEFKMKWNMTDYGGTWIIDPNSVTEAGCIHTAQGLEVDYIGVIIGDDLIVRNGIVLVDPTKRDKSDKTIFGYKKLMKENPNDTKELVRAIIKNTYRTLMTRGMKGCYIYCTDKETREYFKNIMS